MSPTKHNNHAETPHDSPYSCQARQQSKSRLQQTLYQAVYVLTTNLYVMFQCATSHNRKAIINTWYHGGGDSGRLAFCQVPKINLRETANKPDTPHHDSKNAITLQPNTYINNVILNVMHLFLYISFRCQLLFKHASPQAIYIYIHSHIYIYINTYILYI